MWRNTVVVEFIEWLRAYNDALPPGAEKVGFYGLDLYSLHASMKAVLQYLEKVDPEAAERGARALLLLRPCRRGYRGRWSDDAPEPFQVV
jgi:erythromycin esterase-like protein